MRAICVLLLLFSGVFGHGSMAMAQSSGTFTATGDMMTPREGHGAILLLNGKVLIAGGYHGTSEDGFPLPTASAELYDPSTGAFTAVCNMMSGIYDPSCPLFAAGDMVTRLYPQGSYPPILLPDGRVFFGGTLLPNGQVFVAGYPTAQLYDPVNNTFAATGPYAAPAPSILGSSTLLADGWVLLTGAVNICFQPLCRDAGTSWTELFDPKAGTFSLAGSMKGFNNIYTATLLTDGKVLFVGNDDYNGIPPSAEVFDPSNGTFAAIEHPSATHEYGAATLLPDGTVLITGGRVPGGNEQVISELYIRASGTFSPVNMITGHVYHTSTLLSDGTVLIAGGSAFSTSSAELYHPAVLVPAPLLLALSGDGRGPGAILHAATEQIVSPDNPAVVGEALEIYLTGLLDGSVIPPQVAIGSRMAEVLFFGKAAGFAGLNQVNVRVPSGVVAGPAVAVRLTYLGRPSNEVTIGVR